MSKLRRFPLTYDEEFDMDIHKMLLDTPQKRRSERVRQLIRLGLSVEAGSHGFDHSPMPRPPLTNSLAPVSVPVEKSPDAVKRERRPLKFSPPS